ncbi:MAG: hypothetical protein GY716_25610 [bacterium]|nr:hypothetical protein [bacterium]
MREGHEVAGGRVDPVAARRLFAASFLALFFELLLIRWVPTEVYYLGYFKNCILLATFLGFGVGCATRFSVDRLLPFYGLGVAAFVILVGRIEDLVKIQAFRTGEVLFPQPTATGVEVPILGLLVVMFVLCALLMLPLGRLVGRLFSEFAPLRAYTINVLASLLGIVTLIALSFFETSPTWWFLLFFLPLFWLLRRDPRGVIVTLVSFVMVVVALQATRDPLEFWSPYHKITLDEQPHELINSRMLMTNNNGHQVLYDLGAERTRERVGRTERAWAAFDKHEAFYNAAYRIVRPKSVLIIGGGTGNEAAAALRNGAERIDVVEIDPVILDIGREYHPERPYDATNVRVINDDARHYLSTTNETYDLIVFGFLDSTSRLSSMANIRLDNYVYTYECLERARTRLNDDGLLQLGYYVVQNFIKIRLYQMLTDVFDQKPLAYANVIFFTGPAVEGRTHLALPGMKQSLPPDDLEAVRYATDDWPYLSLAKPSISRDYVISLALMLVLSIVMIGIFLGRSAGERFRSEASALFLLQGIAFMLLETNCINRMALVLGSTWIVTSVAIVFVLISSLLSIAIVRRGPWPGVPTILGFLAASLVLNFFVDVNSFFGLPRAAQIVIPSLIVYLPILGSSLLFCRMFQGQQTGAFYFGINLLGAMLGGFLEYLTLVIGIRNLYLVGLAVVAALAIVYVRSRTTQEHAAPQLATAAGVSSRRSP